MADFSKGITKDKNNICKLLKDKQLRQNSIFPPKSFNNEGKIKLFRKTKAVAQADSHYKK